VLCYPVQEGQTALIIAAQGDHVEAVSLLLERGASTEVADRVRTGR
jgi:ankyrin repeat protein